MEPTSLGLFNQNNESVCHTLLKKALSNIDYLGLTKNQKWTIALLSVPQWTLQNDIEVKRGSKGLQWSESSLGYTL
jgi:hypothetical protein